MAALQNWITQAREHWKEFQPTRYESLKATGKLDTALKDAAERTFIELVRLEEMGFKNHEAWEMARETHLFPPEEGALHADHLLEGERVAEQLHEAARPAEPVPSGLSRPHTPREHRKGMKTKDLTRGNQTKMAKLMQDMALAKQAQTIDPQVRNYIEREYRSRILTPLFGALVISGLSYVVWGHW